MLKAGDYRRFLTPTKWRLPCHLAMPSGFRNSKHIDQWIVLSSGFTEKLGDSSGTRYLWRGLRKSFVDHRTSVRMGTWKDDWEQVAELIATETRDGNNGPAKVVFAGYSWGGGYAFIEFANACRDRGIDIAHAVLCDAVYYSPFPSWSVKAYQALFGTQPIVVPSNVARVTWFRQATDKWLRGHDVIAKSSDTYIDGPNLLNSDHAHADDQKPWHDMCWQACEEVLS